MILPTALTLLAALPALAAVWLADAPTALAQAKASGKPVLVDFAAPWCYSCYYMEQRVLSKPAFDQAAAGLVLLKLDVDTPEGAALKKERSVTFLPSYLVLSPSGKELGRIVGEHTEADFLAKLGALAGGKELAQDRELAALRAKARKGDVDALKKALDRPADCETPYDALFAASAVDKLYPEHRDAVLKKERAALETLAAGRLFSGAETRCADFRSGIDALADVYEKLGDKAARSAILARALTQLEKEGSVGEDRNRDDNRRHFLEKQGDAEAIRAWYEKLVAAYPADYVYAFRYARWLHKNGQTAAAEGWSERADKLSYGSNRLAVTALRAKILAALGKKDLALAAIERDLKAASKSWKAERAELESVRASLRR